MTGHTLTVIRQQLRAARERAGLDQATAARKIGRTRANLANFEQGRQDIPLSVFLDLVSALGLRLTLEPLRPPRLVITGGAPMNIADLRIPDLTEAEAEAFTEAARGIDVEVQP